MKHRRRIRRRQRRIKHKRNFQAQYPCPIAEQADSMSMSPSMPVAFVFLLTLFRTEEKC